MPGESFRFIQASDFHLENPLGRFGCFTVAVARSDGGGAVAHRRGRLGSGIG